MPCVVCGGQLVEQHFANAWEKTRKVYGCCSPACASKFDPDEHWLPAVAPTHAAAEEQGALLQRARSRLRAGHAPRTVVRELLVAGVGLVGVETLLTTAERDAAVDTTAVRKRNIFSAFMFLLFGRLARELPEPQRPEMLRAATVDVEAWRSRFGPPDDPTRSA
jgi:hypothetical protein